jgi:hypothetical protein
MVKSADKEDGTLWPNQAHLAHWSGMTVRNVARILVKLEKAGLIKVWPIHNRSSVYQVQCPYLSKLGDLERVELLRGVKLGDPRSVNKDTPDNLSGEVEGTSCQVVPDNSGPEGDPKCPTEVVQGTTPFNNEEDQGSTSSSEPQAASNEEVIQPSQPEGAVSFSVEDPKHPNPIRPKGDESARVIMIPMVDSNGRPFVVTEGLVARFSESYPGIDVRQELRLLREWNLTHNRNRKTPSGIQIHITSWLGRAQNKATRGSGPGGGANPAPSKQEDAIERARRAQHG